MTYNVMNVAQTDQEDRQMSEIVVIALAKAITERLQQIADITEVNDTERAEIIADVIRQYFDRKY
jgi:predicted transcriptional regulator